jgi:hypothetical protein
VPERSADASAYDSAIGHSVCATFISAIQPAVEQTLCATIVAAHLLSELAAVDPAFCRA